jgi:hypothetical protein
LLVVVVRRQVIYLNFVLGLGLGVLNLGLAIEAATKKTRTPC